MTAPNVTGEDPRIEELRRVGRERGYSEAEIQARLEQAGLVQRSIGGGFGRDLGLAARGLVQGGANLVGLPFALGGAAYQAATGNPAPQMLRPQGQAVADQMGLPQPGSPGERTAIAAGENATMAAMMPGASAAGMALGAGAGAAGQAAQEAGMGPMGQMAAQAVVGLGIPIVAPMAAEMIRTALTGAMARRQAAQQSAALLRAGDPNAGASFGQITQRPLVQAIQGGMGKVPGAAQTLQTAATQQAANMQGRANDVADAFSPRGNVIAAGRTVQRGIEEGFIPNFKATGKALYNKVFSVVAANTLVQPSATGALFAQQGQLLQAAKPFADDFLIAPQMQKWGQQLADALRQNPNGIEFGTLKAFRTLIGDAMTGAPEMVGPRVGELRKLYAALSADMETAVAQHGPQALKDWQRANLFWEKGMNRIENLLQPILDKKVPDQAFTALMSGTREGGSVLQSTMRSLAPAERDVVRSTVVRRMGMADPGNQNAASDVFSPSTFLTRWNQLSPIARGALFDGADPATVANLNSLAKAAELVKNSAKAMPNPSGTAQATAFGAILNGLGVSGIGVMTGSPGMVATGLAPLGGATALNVAAKMFTSPRVISWLVKTTKVPFGMMAQQLAILAKDSQKWPERDRETADDLTSALGNIDWSQILTAQAVADGLAAR